MVHYAYLQNSRHLKEGKDEVPVMMKPAKNAEFGE